MAKFVELLAWIRSYMSAIEGGKVNVILAILEGLTIALDVSVNESLK